MSADNWAECPRCHDPADGRTFREEWEIGVEDGELLIDYFGRCKVCELSVKFHHLAVVDLGGAP